MTGDQRIAFLRATPLFGRFEAAIVVEIASQRLDPRGSGMLEFRSRDAIVAAWRDHERFRAAVENRR